MRIEIRTNSDGDRIIVEEMDGFVQLTIRDEENEVTALTQIDEHDWTALRAAIESEFARRRTV